MIQEIERLLEESRKTSTITIQDVEIRLSDIDRVVFNTDDFEKIPAKDHELYDQMGIHVHSSDSVEEGKVFILKKFDWEEEFRRQAQEALEPFNSFKWMYYR